MTLRERVETEMRNALRAGEHDEAGTLRMLIAALHNEAIAKRTKLARRASGEGVFEATRPEKEAGLSEEEEIAVLRRELKKREEAASEYARAGRDDLQQKELKETEVIKRYLPQELSRHAIQYVLREEIAKGAATLPELMKHAMPKLRGQVSGDRVRKVAEELLSDA